MGVYLSSKFVSSQSVSSQSVSSQSVSFPFDKGFKPIMDMYGL